MKISVVVSTYNQVKYISECLDSILSQKTSADFNIIVSDDRSTDGTQDIIRKYSINYPGRFILKLRTENVGPALNYMELHEMADGEIVFHMDGDDVMLPGKIEKQFRQFSNPEVNFSLHQANYFSDDRKLYRPTGSLKPEEGAVVYFSAAELALWGTISVHSSYAYRRSSRKVFVLDREFMEWFFAMDSLLPAGKAAFINEILLEYRSNANGGSYLSSSKGRLKAYSIYFRDIYIYFKKYPRLRSALYANAAVSFLAMFKNTRQFNKELFLFLMKNVLYLRFGLLFQSYQIRRRVAPLAVTGQDK